MAHRLVLLLAAGLLLACLAPAHAQEAEPRFLQKVVTMEDMSTMEIPEALLVAGRPTPWTHWEPGPVPNLRVHAVLDNGVVWLGSEMGAARFDPAASHAWDRWHYFYGKRWLPDNRIERIVVERQDGDETAWIRTPGGVSRIAWEPMWFEQKAAFYEEMVQARHLRHDFVSECILLTPGDLATSATTDSDNDGLWTAMYLAAQAYQYATTGSPEARARARRALDALLKLEAIAPIPGFYARSYRRLDTAHPHQDGGEWHPAGDGELEWKGDTSSDESVGHYYAFALYHDLVADVEERRLLADHLRKLTDYLIANDYELLDLDGKPTRWGLWSEAYYQTPEGDYEKALRSLELLAFLKTTYHVTGDSRYQEAYLDRVRRGYAQHTLDYRRWPSEEWEINFSDDELYYLSIEPLLRYETDPVLRQIYLESLRFTWTQVQPDRNALWNFMSAALGAGPLTPELQADSRRTLERTPLDLVEWTVENGHRADVRFNRDPDRHGQRELNRVLPPDERRVHKHNTSPYVADGGNGGRSEEAPTFWLLPYWMGRYYGFLR